MFYSSISSSFTSLFDVRSMRRVFGCFLFVFFHCNYSRFCKSSLQKAACFFLHCSARNSEIYLPSISCCYALDIGTEQNSKEQPATAELHRHHSSAQHVTDRDLLERTFSENPIVLITKTSPDEEQIPWDEYGSQILPVEEEGPTHGLIKTIATLIVVAGFLVSLYYAVDGITSKTTISTFERKTFFFLKNLCCWEVYWFSCMRWRLQRAFNSNSCCCFSLYFLLWRRFRNRDKISMRRFHRLFGRQRRKRMP